jgi:type IV pilus assembly protein PilB
MLVGRLDRLEEAVADVTEADAEAEAEALAEAAAAMTMQADDEAPVVKLVNSIIAQAVEQRASDIHFTPHNGEMRVQYRVDGVLGDGIQVPRRLRQGVVTRVKIMAELDIAERRAPQDGRIGLKLDGRHVDVRVVTLPLVDGESIVMRILERDSTRIGLDQLGMAGDARERFERAFHQSYGAVLVTGPTGSGKTTSLYAAMHELNTNERSIVTIEDPVEYRLDGLRQMQINPKAGVTFAKGLRSMMRADPDVVMVGEIRDRETAQIAVEAALTGHLVLSTLHTNDAATAITRLIEMGVEPFLVASAIDCVVAQRLARRLCEHCKVEKTYSAESLRASGFLVDEDLVAYDAGGCGRCAHTGYRGRVGLYEVMAVSEEIRALALGREPATTISDVAVDQGMRRLRDDAFEKVRAGETTLAELARVTGG